MFFFLFSDIERKVFVVSAENHRHDCQNWILTIHRSSLRTKYWEIFCVPSDLSRKLSKFQLKRWNKSVGNALFLSTRIIWGKLEFLKKKIVVVFSIRAKTFWIFEIKASPGLSNLLWIFPEEHFEENSLNNFYISYRVLSEKFPDFWMKNLWRAVGTTLIKPGGIIWRKLFCLGKKLFFIFRILHEKFLDFGHKSIELVVRTEIQLFTNNFRRLKLHRFFVFLSDIRQNIFGLVVHYLRQLCRMAW